MDKHEQLTELAISIIKSYADLFLELVANSN